MTTSPTTRLRAGTTTLAAALLAAAALLLGPLSGSAAAQDGDADSRTRTGPTGQTLTVTPADGLDPSGAALTVTGSGYDDTIGVYVGLCVDQGPDVAPSPCVGGVDMTGGAGSSVWVSSNPPVYAAGLTTPYGPGGTFSVDLVVRSADEHVDCFAEGVRCVISTRADHTNGSVRSADVKLPVSFVGQDPIVDDEQPTTTTTTTAAPAPVDTPDPAAPAPAPPAPAPSDPVPAQVAGVTADPAGGGARGAQLALTGPNPAPLAIGALALVAAGAVLVSVGGARRARIDNSRSQRP